MLRLDAKSFAEESIGTEVDMSRVTKRLALAQFRERFLIDRREPNDFPAEFRCKVERFARLAPSIFMVHNWPELLRRHHVNVLAQRDFEKHVTDMSRLVRYKCGMFVPLTAENMSHARDVIDENTADDSIFEFAQDQICIGMIQDAVLEKMADRGICEYSQFLPQTFLRNPHLDTVIDDCVWDATNLLLPIVCRGLFTETLPESSRLHHFQEVPMGYPS